MFSCWGGWLSSRFVVVRVFTGSVCVCIGSREVIMQYCICSGDERWSAFENGSTKRADARMLTHASDLHSDCGARCFESTVGSGDTVSVKRPKPTLHVSAASYAHSTSQRHGSQQHAAGRAPRHDTYWMESGAETALIELRRPNTRRS